MSRDLHRFWIFYVLPVPLARAWIAGLVFLGMLSRKWQFVGPRILHLTLPASCNHNCVFCITDVHGSGAVGNRSVLGFEQIQTVIETALENGTLHIHFTSQGEPCLYPRLAELLDWIHRRSRGRAVVQIVTNGTLLDRIGVDRILKQGIQLWVSLHSAEETIWEKIHRPIGISRFAALQENLKAILASKPRLVTLHNVICNLNFEHLDTTADWAIAAGAKKLFFGRMYRFPELQLNPDQEKQVLNKLNALEPKLRAAGIDTNIAGYRDVAVSKPPAPLVDQKNPAAVKPSSEFYRSHACYIGWLFTPVSEEGAVSSCGRGRALGSVKEHALDEILNRGLPGFNAQSTRIAQLGGRIEGCDCAECPHIQMNRIANHFVRKFGRA